MQPTDKFLAVRAWRLTKLRTEYKNFIKTAVANVGNAQDLASEIGMPQNYINEALNGNLSQIKKCAELIAELSPNSVPG